MREGETVVSVENLTKKMGGKKIFDDVSFEVDKGKMLAIVGKKKSGKTTLMKIFTGFENPDKGKIIIDGKNCTGDLEYIRNYVGYVPEGLVMYNKLTVKEYMKLFIEMNYMPVKHTLEIADNLLTYFGLEEYKKTCIKKLTKGQQVKLSIARALIKNPKILLIDNPFDKLSDDEIYEVKNVLDFFMDSDGTVIVTLEDIQIAAWLDSKVIIMDRGKMIDGDSYCKVYRNRMISSKDNDKEKQEASQKNELTDNMEQQTTDADNSNDGAMSHNQNYSEEGYNEGAYQGEYQGNYQNDYNYDLYNQNGYNMEGYDMNAYPIDAYGYNNGYYDNQYNYMTQYQNGYYGDNGYNYQDNNYYNANNYTVISGEELMGNDPNCNVEENETANSSDNSIIQDTTLEDVNDIDNVNDLENGYQESNFEAYSNNMYETKENPNTLEEEEVQITDNESEDVSTEETKEQSQETQENIRESRDNYSFDGNMDNIQEQRFESDERQVQYNKMMADRLHMQENRQPVSDSFRPAMQTHEKWFSNEDSNIFAEKKIGEDYFAIKDKMIGEEFLSKQFEALRMMSGRRRELPDTSSERENM